jgi:Tfp pilus assembly protein PilF
LHYQKAITLQPNPVEARYNSQLQAHFNLGLIYKSQKKLPEAEAEFRACVQQQPELSRAHAALAETLRAMGKRDEAGRESQVAVQLQMKELRQMMSAGKDK